MKVTIKETDDTLALVRAMASTDRNESLEAQAATATIVGPVLQEVIESAPTLSNWFTTETFDWDDNPSILLDLFRDIQDDNFIRTWSNTTAGDLAYNEVVLPEEELKFRMFDLDTAYAFDKDYMGNSRLNVVGQVFSRMGQELLNKRESYAYKIIAPAVAGGSTHGLDHVIRAGQDGKFSLDDINKLTVRAKRLRTSYNQNTPVGGLKVGITDLVISPELVGKIREMAYSTVSPDPSHTIAAPDDIRNGYWAGAGEMSFYGIGVQEFAEFGIGQRFNKVFGVAAGSKNFSEADGTSGSAQFTQASEEIALAIDANFNSQHLIRAVQRGKYSGQVFDFQPDDQFYARHNKMGWFGNVREGQMITDDRGLLGMIYTEA